MIGIPFGIQAFTLAGDAPWPFGRVAVRRPGASGAAAGREPVVGPVGAS